MLNKNILELYWRQVDKNKEFTMDSIMLVLLLNFSGDFESSGNFESFGNLRSITSSDAFLFSLSLLDDGLEGSTTLSFPTFISCLCMEISFLDSSSSVLLLVI